MKFDVLTINTAVGVFGIIICTIVILCRGFIVGSHDRKIRNDFTLLVLCEAFGLFFGVLSDIFTGQSSPVSGFILSAAVFFNNMLTCLMTGFFTNFVTHTFASEKRKPIVFSVWVLVSLGIVMLAVNSVFPVFYYIDAENICRRAKLYMISQVPHMLICIENLAYIIINGRKAPKLTFFSFLSYLILPMCALCLQSFLNGLDVLNIAMIIVLMLMFVVMQNQLVNDYLEQKRQLQESSVKLMISQVKPHFIFNSLTAIAQLCDDDPALAKKTTVSFAKYLRGNLSALEKTEAVPFEDELNHIKNYLNIESVRFGDDLHIVYDIETTDFKVPVLSIQPLIENAVKHGVGMKENGGTVTLSVHRLGGSVEIKITDDGVGFDTAAPLPDSGHIGILNSTKRLKMLCGAETEIESEIGKGTVITVTLPQTK